MIALKVALWDCPSLRYSKSTVVWAIAWMMVTLASVLVTTPARLWSPTSKHAIAVVRHTRLARTLWLPIVGIPLAIWFLVALTMTTLVVTERRMSSLSAEMIVITWAGALGLFAATAVLMLWISGVMADKKGAEAMPDQVCLARHVAEYREWKAQHVTHVHLTVCTPYFV